MDSNSHDDNSVSQGRRELLQALVAGSGWVATRALLPAVWSSPIVGSMLLPEHAAASYSTTTTTSTATAVAELVGTGPNKAAIVSTADSGKVILTIYPPEEVFADRIQYAVYERDQATSVETVVALMTPSSDRTLSGRAEVQVPHSAGSYEYQLRLIDGRHTAWQGGVQVQ